MYILIQKIKQLQIQQQNKKIQRTPQPVKYQTVMYAEINHIVKHVKITLRFSIKKDSALTIYQLSCLNHKEYSNHMHLLFYKM